MDACATLSAGNDRANALCAFGDGHVVYAQASAEIYPSEARSGREVEASAYAFALCMRATPVVSFYLPCSCSFVCVLQTISGRMSRSWRGFCSDDKVGAAVPIRSFFARMQHRYTDVAHFHG